MIFIRWFLQIRCTCSMLHYQPIRTLANQSNLNAKALRRWVAKFSTANNETLRRFFDDYGYEKMVSAPNKKQQCSFFPFEKRFSPRCGLSQCDISRGVVFRMRGRRLEHSPQSIPTGFATFRCKIIYTRNRIQLLFRFFQFAFMVTDSICTISAQFSGLSCLAPI